MSRYIGDSVPTGRLDKPLRPNMEPIHALCDYDPRFCNIVHELGKEGKTYAEMCAALNISKKRSEVWRSKYEEYDDAVHAGLTAAEAYYNAMGQRNIEWVNSKGEEQFRDPVWKEIKSEFKATIVKDAEDKEADEAADTIIKSVARRIQKGEDK